MNIQQQESNIASMLLQCIHTMQHSGIHNKHVKLFESNFMAMYNDINQLTPLNESVEEPSDDYKIVMNNPENIAAYLRKVLTKLDSDIDIIMNLNENFRMDNGEMDEHDIEGFKVYARRLLKFFLKQNDIKNIQPNILSIKRTLNLPIRVQGMDITKIPECDTAVYDATNNLIILVQLSKGVMLYSIETDDFVPLSTITQDESFISKLKMSNVLNMFKWYCHPNMVLIYQNPKSLNLKYTDNLYKDQAQKSHIEDLKKLQKLNESYSQLQSIFG